MSNPTRGHTPTRTANQRPHDPRKVHLFTGPEVSS